MQPVTRGERAASAAKFEPETDASQILSREAYPSEDVLRISSAFIIFNKASDLVRRGLVEITVTDYYVSDPLESRQITVDPVDFCLDKCVCLLRRIVRSELSLKNFLVESDSGTDTVPR